MRSSVVSVLSFGGACVVGFAFACGGGAPPPQSPSPNASTSASATATDTSPGLVPPGSEAPIGAASKAPDMPAATNVTSIDAEEKPALPKTVNAFVSSPAPSGVVPIVAKNQWRLRACFEKTLSRDEQLREHVELQLKVDADGKVASVTRIRGGEDAFATCAVAAFRAVAFDAGSAGTFSVTIDAQAKQP
jgi:hypothetical protein